MGVVNFISLWLKDIVVLFIIIFISELIMPKGNMKRYINLIIGLLIIITIVAPLAKLMDYNFNINNIVDNYTKIEELELDISNDFSNEQDDQIERLFKDRLKNQIIYLIEENSEYQVFNIDIELENTKKDYENIKFIDILLEEASQEENNDKESNISIEKVSKVEINKNEEDKSDFQTKESKKFNNIEKLIANEFSIDIKKINIQQTIKKKGE